MNEVRLPIKTIRNGEEITKICVEDVYKIINRIVEAVDKSYNNITEIVNSVHKEYDDYEGELIIGTGVSKPCNGDKFDEKLGNEIAFKKAKLNANFKKAMFIEKIARQLLKAFDSVVQEHVIISEYLYDDFTDLQEYNPDYMKNNNKLMDAIEYCNIS